jgi:hypothetical protein
MQSTTHSCDRCAAPQGRVVLLNNRERVCGACIEETGSLLLVAERIGTDMTPSIECRLAV